MESMAYALERYAETAYPPGVASLGENIERLRRLAGYKTQVALADAMGVKSQMISDWENDRRQGLDMSSLVRLARVLRAPIDAIVEGFDTDYDKMRSDLLGQTRPVQEHTGGEVDTNPVGLLEQRESFYQGLVASAIAEIEKIAANLKKGLAVETAHPPARQATRRTHGRKTRRRTS